MAVGYPLNPESSVLLEVKGVELKVSTSNHRAASPDHLISITNSFAALMTEGIPRVFHGDRDQLYIYYKPLCRHVGKCQRESLGGC